MTHRSLAAAAIMVSLAIARTTGACPPAQPGLTGSIPTDQSTYPANGFLLFWGHDISLAGVTVTIDGQPATLGLMPGLPFGGLIALVSPQPVEGQVVVVQGDFCNPGNTCPIVTLTYTAGPNDNDTPAASGVPAFDVYDYPDFEALPGSCQLSSELAYWVKVATTSAGPDEAPVMAIVNVYSNPPAATPIESRMTFVSAGTTTFEFRRFLSELGGAAPADAYCFDAEVLDTAGNVAGKSMMVCSPCHFRADPPGMSTTEPTEPAWSDADIYPGGSCDFGTGGGGTGSGGAGGAGSGAGGTGGGDIGVDPDGGGACSCRVVGASSEARDRSRSLAPSETGLALGLLGAALAACRRRVRARTRPR